MGSFSERHNYIESRTVIQREELDEETRIALWNLFYAFNGKLGGDHLVPRPEILLAKYLWCDFLKNPLDDYSSAGQVWAELKELVLYEEWYNLFDLTEFLLTALPMASHQSELARTINNELESKLTGYRVINSRVVPVDSEAEGVAISGGLGDAVGEPLAGVRHHLATAIDLLADREKPDYANSVKESISAVEAICELLTGEGVLSKALPKLVATDIKIHPAQVEAWKKLYGWTSDEDGVRHSAKAIPEVDQATAKYMLVTCSAFVSLIIEQARKASVVGLIGSA